MRQFTLPALLAASTALGVMSCKHTPIVLEMMLVRLAGSKGVQLDPVQTISFLV